MKKSLALFCCMLLLLSSCSVKSNTDSFESGNNSITSETYNFAETAPTHSIDSCTSETTHEMLTYDMTALPQTETTLINSTTEDNTDKEELQKQPVTVRKETISSKQEPKPTEPAPTESSKPTTSPREEIPKHTENNPTKPSNEKPELSPTDATQTQQVTKPTEPIVPAPTEAETSPTEPAPTELNRCAHDWKAVHHKEKGHWIAGIVCDCGWTAYGKANELISKWNAHCTSFPAEEALFEHGGYGSADEWIIDEPAYDEWVCCHCGEPKP